MLDAPKGKRDLSAFKGLTPSEETQLQNLGRQTYALWRHLANHLGELTCRKCSNTALIRSGVHANQLAAVVRGLRVAGFSIPKNQRITCTTHGVATADQLTSLVPVAQNSRLRFAYSPAEKTQMKALCGNADAYDGDRSAGLELDHRVPMIRASQDETPIDPRNEAQVRETFMCLTPQHNLRKSRACEKCVETGQRPVFFNNIPFWYEGTQTYEPEIGCRGCPWAYPEKWNAAVAAQLEKSDAPPPAT